MSEKNTPDSEQPEVSGEATEAAAEETVELVDDAEQSSELETGDAAESSDAADAEPETQADEIAASEASAEASAAESTEASSDASDSESPAEDHEHTDDDAIAAAVEAELAGALTGSIPVVKVVKPEPEATKLPLSGAHGDFQGSTQFVYDQPANVYVYPGIQDAPARKNIFAKDGALAKTGILAPVVLTIGALVGGAIGGAAVSGALNANNHSSSSITINNPESVSWATAAAAKASQSVVTISVTGAGSGGIGSGVILTKDGYILTNTHVVTLDGATTTPSIQVKFSDGKIVDGQLVGTDPTNDLAVIKVAGTGLQPATFADSTQVNVGDSVLAIGAPLGLDATVTKGIVSTLNRTIDEASSAPNAAATGATIHMSVIQTDAAINPGNSGGALVDAKGDVIGINVAIATAGSSSLGGQPGSIGVGFAIPSNIAQRIAKDIMQNGKATHGLLGAQIYNNAKSNMSDAFSNGAKVDSLTPGGAGEKAGLKKGDVVIAFNDTKVSTASDLTALVRQQPAGAAITLTVLRGTQTITLNVVLGNADQAK